MWNEQRRAFAAERCLMELLRRLRGSDNKQLHFLTGRYCPADFEHLPEAEVLISPDGQVTFSGIEPPAHF